jgi:hypothetical protein
MIMVGFRPGRADLRDQRVIRGYELNLTDPSFLVGIVLIVVGLLMA